MDFLQYKWTLAVTLLTNAVHVWCFLPTLTTTTPPDTYSHVQITRDGVKKAAANFLTDNGLVEGSYSDPDRVLAKYFGSDTDSQEKFNQKMRDLSARMNTVQNDVKLIAKYTVNGERIEDAFNLLKKLSGQTRVMTLLEPYDTAAQESTFDNLAKALLVIQSFYSSTNWAEMNGDVVCPAFGGDGTSLPKIVKAWEATCSNCDPNVKYDCLGNMVTNSLTSGFRPEQDVKIPHLNTGLKCAHDWNTDNTRLAIGGIGKDTTDANLTPHADIHPDAVVAAIRATTEYLYQNGKGILSNLSVDEFKNLFDLKSREKESRGSLTIVMDVSGSMSDDMKAARDACINLVSAVQGTPNEPTDYILATFNDPDNKTTGERFTNGDDIINKLHSLVADGGGDCPEYAISGILRGISLTKNGSYLYMFTDADASDGDRMGEAIAKAKAKHIKITPVLTGSCNRRRRQATRRVARAIHDVYFEMAAATGGQVYETTKSELGAVLSKIMQKEMPSSSVVLRTFKIHSTGGDRGYVIVDASMNLLKIEVDGAASVDDIRVEDPNGSKLQYLPGFASRYYSDGKVIISVQKPVTGKWTIIRTATKSLTVRASGSSSLDFSLVLTEQDESGVPYIIQGNPIAGQNYSILTQLFNLGYNASLDDMSLVNLFGDEVEKVETSLRRIGSEVSAVANFKMPTQRVRVQITGALPGGESFQRTNLQIISPVSVELRLQTNLDPLPFNEPQNITYFLGNHGPNNETFIVDVDADYGGLSNVMHTMYPGEVNGYIYQVIGRTTSKTLKYTVSVRQQGSEQTLQSLSGSVWFENPACDVIHNGDACPETVNSPASCQSITWSSRAVFSPEVKSYEISTIDANIEIMANYTTDDGKQYINISGDCCSPSVYLSALGSSGYMIGQCHFNFGSLPTITITELEPSDWTLFGVIFGVAAVCLIVLATIALWRQKREGNFHVMHQ
ncbi:von Willebrand factor A domain-containing protein 7-like [Mizuhopecten yessoensis]|uniref:von Willebrand factor A domain-containing protein 7-like n=1 Tax=Mizuhopecten yessoensis TaxID=6573 RepID=UPI000B45AD55|nr:von Willebrand factor A domain-containing protein 7-like [Mizuhopecten yessoensis]XP_021347181.1 von Willebrand factor A domain-containing protein 7-like [Mizuhopecten yessoensis]